jgi:hypothetical protein
MQHKPSAAGAHKIRPGWQKNAKLFLEYWGIKVAQ